MGKVIAIGDSSVPAAAGKDYAIVRINKISDIKPAIVSTDDIRSEDSLMSVGFPLRSTYSQKTGLRYPTANFAKMTGTGTDGTFKTSNSLSRPGGSGSGIFILDNDNGRPQVMLGGIHQSEGGVGLQTSTIIEHLKISNPKVLSELSAAIESGACN